MHGRFHGYDLIVGFTSISYPLFYHILSSRYCIFPYMHQMIILLVILCINLMYYLDGMDLLFNLFAYRIERILKQIEMDGLSSERFLVHRALFEQHF